MRMIYVGPLNSEGTCLVRLRTLQELADVVAIVDSQRHETLSGIEKIFFNHPIHQQLNEELKTSNDKFKPDLIWIDKGYWISAATFNALKKGPSFIIQHNTDALNPRRWQTRFLYWRLRQQLYLNDLYITSNLPDFESLARLSCPHVLLTHLGYDASRFDSRTLDLTLKNQWQTDVLFIGHYEPRTERYIISLIDAGLPITVYGDGWHRARHRKKLHGYVRFKSLSNEEYVWALKSTKIGLCFVSEENFNQTAGRSFEIPACGTFLLAVRTPQHLESYIEGEEAEFFSDAKELVEKVCYYLKHDDERGRIAQKGFERCTKSGYSWQEIMKRDWNKVMEYYSRKQYVITPAYCSITE